MPAESHPGRSAADVGSGYYYRRALSARELLPAAGIALGAGLVAFYFAKLFIARTPLIPEPRLAPSGRDRRRRGRDEMSRVRGG